MEMICLYSVFDVSEFELFVVMICEEFGLEVVMVFFLDVGSWFMLVVKEVVVLVVME